MYRETRETIFTIILTAAIVGGGMYWFYNRNAETNPLEAAEEETVLENEVGLPELNEEIIVEDEGDSPTELKIAQAFEPQIFTNTISHYSIDFPKNWYARHYKLNGQNTVAFDSRPLSETPAQETNGKISIDVISYRGVETLLAADEQWLTNVTKKTHMYAEAWPMTIMRGEMAAPALTSPGATNVRMNAYITKDGVAYVFTGVGLTPEEEKIFEQMVKSFRFLDNLADNNETKLQTAVFFEAEIFTNKIYKYSIDFPKNWYWHHYGIQESDGSDIVSFDTQSLSETLQGEYAGKVVIITRKGSEFITNEDQIAEMKKWLNNVTVRTVSHEGTNITIMRGEMPEDGLAMGSTNVRMSAFLTKDDIHYSISIAGPTPEEEKIFEQMVASFRLAPSL